ncbi:MAG: bile acid:sodium symporter [Deltaproteobacteria bacterium]|jgi:sodium/bile acid cotransporter 7|nr:bile acid:sodium symporter [Deltaproteobacteria bacterium]
MLKGVKVLFQKYLDPFTLILVLALALAFILPVEGKAYDLFYILSKLVVALLFFLHGARLSPGNILDGLTNYKLQLLIFFSTFAVFPLLALLLKPLLLFLLNPDVTAGFLFLACLPSTVQSSIAFTSIARGNVSAAVCAASASSLLGIILTPLLVSLIIHPSGHAAGLQTLRDLFLQLLLPFALGQFFRPLLIDFLKRRQALTSVTDRLSVIFIVYVSFSQATNTGLWNQMDLKTLPLIVAVCLVMLAAALIFTWKTSGLCEFPRPDRTAALFCGSKKSLMTGVPMANIIFTPQIASLLIIPLMVFHQIQLIVCAFLARSLSRRDGDDGAAPEGKSEANKGAETLDDPETSRKAETDGRPENGGGI